MFCSFLFCFFKLSSISHHFFPLIQTQGRGQTSLCDCKTGFPSRGGRRHFMYLVNINPFHSQLIILQLNVIQAVPDIVSG